MPRKRDRHVDLACWFVNVDNNRPDAVVAAELRAIRGAGADLIGMCETTSNALPHLGMTFVGDRRGGEANRPRRNIAAYVDRTLPLARIRWHDMARTWPRTKGDGRHEPRSFVTFRLGRVKVIVAHHPPGSPGTDPARAEHLRALTYAVAPWLRPGRRWRQRAQQLWLRRRPVVVLIDANGCGDELAAATGMAVHGRGADRVLALNAEVHDVEYVARLGDRVTFAGDHGHVLRATVRIARRFLRLLPAGGDRRLEEIPS